MPALAERREIPHRPPDHEPQDVAAALSALKIHLEASLSGGSSSWYVAKARSALPSTMLRPVAFDDSDDDRLTVVHLVPVDEDDDQW